MVTIPEVAKLRHETDAEEPDRPEEASTAAASPRGLHGKRVPLLTPEELADKTEAVRNDIAALLLAKDIPTTPPAKRYVAQADAVRVKGGHPHKAEIEQAPAKDEASPKDFRPVGIQTSIQTACATHMAFAPAYTRNPDAAVARFTCLFDDLPDAPFTMTVGEKEPRPD
ncbi:hypothetical protein [Desulfovibrio sp. Huiquan2017]|uniref:hypothetical protein n=1 Tax=Desulfovibrio sp. Huiquan2017 TaxID=2816861 RepID=UPI001A91F9E6|nr:hypothetical protein [Desulfovibrio sp. Huiquan2017]